MSGETGLWGVGKWGTARWGLSGTAEVPKGFRQVRRGTKINFAERYYEELLTLIQYLEFKLRGEK